MEHRFKRKILQIMLLTMWCSAACCLEPAIKGNSNQVVRFGRLLFSSSDQIPTNEGVDEGVLHEFAWDTDEFLSDQTDSTVESRNAYLKLLRLSPSVQCDDDSMTLNIQGNRVPHFFTESDEGASVPLAHLPSHCGFSVKRARRDVSLVARYNGCNVTQQGNTYVLPLRLWGARVRMACPVVAPCPTVSCTNSAMVIKVGASIDGVKLKVNNVWQPLSQALNTCGFTLVAAGSGGTITAPYTSNCLRKEGAKTLLSMLYMNEMLAVSCPVQPPATTASLGVPSADAPLPAQDVPAPLVPNVPMGYPFFYDYPMPYQYGFPWVSHRQPKNDFTTTAPTTTTPATVPVKSADQLWQPVPWLPSVYNPFVPMQSPGLPAQAGDHRMPRPWSNSYWPIRQYPMPGSLSANPATAVKPQDAPQVSWPVWQYPMPGSSSAKPSTAVKPQDAPQVSWPVWQYPMPGSSSAKPSTAVKPQDAPQVSWPVWQYPMPGSSSAKPSTAVKPQDAPQVSWPVWQYPMPGSSSAKPSTAGKPQDAPQVSWPVWQYPMPGSSSAKPSTAGKPQDAPQVSWPVWQYPMPGSSSAKPSTAGKPQDAPQVSWPVWQYPMPGSSSAKPSTAGKPQDAPQVSWPVWQYPMPGSSSAKPSTAGKPQDAPQVSWPVWQYPMPGSSSAKPSKAVKPQDAPQVSWPTYYSHFTTQP